MLVTTTPNIEGSRISKYYSLVSASGTAVITVGLDYETISSGSGNMLMVTAIGTAVKYAG